MPVDLAPFLISVGSSAVVAAVVTALLKRGENEQLHAQNKTIETLRSDLRQLESRSKTQFDWLHQRKAEAAVQVYGLLVDLESAAFSRMFNEVILKKDDDGKLRADETAAVKAYSKTCGRLALLLPEAVNTELRELNTALHFMDDSERWQEAKDRIKGLRATLRTVLGDVEKDARAQSGGSS